MKWFLTKIDWILQIGRDDEGTKLNGLIITSIMIVYIPLRRNLIILRFIGVFGKIAISWALRYNENFYCDVNIIASSSFQTYRFIEIHTTALCAFYTLCVLRHRTSLDNLKLITKKVVRKTDKCTNAPLKDTCADIGYRCTDPMNKENRESFDVHEYYFHLCILNHMNQSRSGRRNPSAMFCMDYTHIHVHVN